MSDANNKLPKGEPGKLSWLVEIMQRLLAPDGCPWDREQSLETLKPYLIEECYEVIEAIESGSNEEHCEELGDLLLQIVFQGALAGISMERVIQGIGDKLIRRHPHVFGDGSADTADQVITNWNAIKAKEKSRESVLDGVPAALPGLHRSSELTRKAEQLGFKFADEPAAFAKVREEFGELDQAATPQQRFDELGDLLFALAAWARQAGMQPEEALRAANKRFESRFRQIETTARSEGTDLSALAEAEWLKRWQATAS